MSIDSVWETRNDNNDMAMLFQQFYLLHVWFNAKIKLCEYNEETGIDRINRKLKAAFF